MSKFGGGFLKEKENPPASKKLGEAFCMRIMGISMV